MPKLNWEKPVHRATQIAAAILCQLNNDIFRLGYRRVSDSLVLFSTLVISANIRKMEQLLIRCCLLIYLLSKEIANVA